MENKAAIYMHINKLKPAPDNPRHNNSAVDKIARSIKLHGFAAPIVANFQNEILAGHTRWKAMQKLNQEEPGKFSMVPVRQIDLTGKQAQLYRIADNKLGELASWDDEALFAQIEELEQEYGEHLDDMGFELNLEEDIFEKIGLDPTEKLEGFLESETLKLTLVYGKEKYNKLVGFLEEQMKEKSYENISDCVYNILGL